MEEIELPCCIEAPPSYIPKAQYALKMLLLPLGIKPVWTEKKALESRGIFYGPARSGVPNEVLFVPLSRRTWTYFDNREPYPLDWVRWEFWENERWPILFSDEGGLEDDFIASAFFWLSGWQEHVSSRRDIHGRYPHTGSLQDALRVTRMPVVDAYRERFVSKLLAAEIPIRRRQWGGRSWALAPTHDIDYLRKWRPGMVWREAVHYLIQNRLQQRLLPRTKRFFHFLFDWVRPGDVFRKSFTRIIDETHSRGGTGTYFIKTDAHGPNDVYYSPRNSFLKKRIDWLEAHDFEVGLHPSYFAYNHPVYMLREKQRLESVCTTPIHSVRQHYLRHSQSITTSLQRETGFRIDSTLAFADHEGFRYGTCPPY